MDAAAASTPEYFINTFGASPDLAASLSQQALARSGTLGREAEIEARHSMDGYVPPPPAAPPPQPTAVEMSQMAQEHSESAAQDAFAQHHAAPQDPSGYEFPRNLGNVTDADIAFDNSIKAALHAEQIPAGLVRNVLSNLNEAVHSQANESEVTRDVRLDATVSRLEAMWQKSGEGTFEDNMAIIRQTLQAIKSPELRHLIEINSSRLSPLDWDAILQYGKYRAGRR